MADADRWQALDVVSGNSRVRINECEWGLRDRISTGIKY